MRGIARALTMAGVLLIAPAAAAQTINAPVRVETGQVYTITVDQTQTSEIAGQDVEATVSHSYALHIIDAEQRIWRYVPASLSYTMPTGLPTPAEATDLNWAVINQAVSAMARVATDIGFECRVDEYGRCMDMTNWSMWRDRAENVVIMADAFARLMPETATESEEPMQDRSGAPKSDEESAASGSAYNWEQMRGPVLRGVAMMLDNVDSRDAAGSLAAMQPGALMQGRSLTRRQPVAVSDEFEMPFGAPPVRFTGTLQLERVNQRDNTATVVRRVSLDQASVREALAGMAQFLTTSVVQPIAASAGEADGAEALSSMIQPMLDMFAIRYEETTTGTVDLSTGLARETVTEYTMTITSTADGAGAPPMTASGRTVIRVTPGAPNVERLPRQ